MVVRPGERRRRGWGASSPRSWGLGVVGPPRDNKLWLQKEERRWAAFLAGPAVGPAAGPAAPAAPAGLRGGGIPFLVWPGYVLSRLLGLLPLRYVPTEGDDGRAAPGILSPSWPWLPFCAAVIATSAYALYFQGNQFLIVVLNPNTTLSNYIYEVPMLLHTVIALVCVVFSLAQSRSMAVCWRSALATLAELDAMNRSPPSTSRQYNPRESWLYFALVWFNLVMIVVTNVLYTTKHEYITTEYQMASVLVVRFVSLAVESQYLLSCLLMQRAYRGIARSFRDAARGFFPSDQAQSLVDGPLGGPVGGPLGHALGVDGGGSGQAAQAAPWAPGKAAWGPHAGHAGRQGMSRQETLSRLRVLHQRVFQQVEDLTGYFGPQLLCKLVHTRIQLITDAFALVRTLQQGEEKEDSTAYFALEVCFLAYRLFVIVYRSEKVLQQDQVLVQLVCLVDPTSWDHASSQQLQLFRRQVRSLRAQLHTCSMFTLNYDLLLAVRIATCPSVALTDRMARSAPPPRAPSSLNALPR